MRKEQRRVFWCTGVTASLFILFFTGTTHSTAIKIAAPSDAVQMDVALGTGAVAPGKAEQVLLKIGLTGAPLRGERSRPPVNVAIVLDRSGSMSGAKLEKAKEAALSAVDRLAPDDIVSLVAYSHTVDVLIPATKVMDRTALRQAIMSIHASGETALFAGVSKGANEVRKFMDQEHVNRVVLVSDGLANVGPSSPGALGDLGAALMKEGVSVTTIGLGEGYNEDLMVALARRSDGNHAFAENATDLARIFDHELGDLLSVVARNITVEIQLQGGARPVRALGRRADITGRRVVSRLNQVYAEQEKFLLLEVAVPASFSGDLREIATVDLRYHDAVANRAAAKQERARLIYTSSPETVAAAVNRDVLIAGAELKANEQNKVAVDLMDKGRFEEAKQMLERNAAALTASSRKLKSARLEKRAAENLKDSNAIKKPAARKVHRKTMRKKQYEQDMQMAW